MSNRRHDRDRRHDSRKSRTYPLWLPIVLAALAILAAYLYAPDQLIPHSVGPTLTGDDELVSPPTSHHPEWWGPH